jgi:hypothetical protein
MLMKSEEEQLEIIRRSIDGTATAEDMQALQERLRQDPAARRLYARYANVDAALGGGGISLHEPAPSSRLAAAPVRWLAWRPLTAAAAGLVLGLFSASLVWAVAAPRLHSRALPLVNADFEEDGAALSADGVPVVYGTWSGDRAEITTAQAGVQPRHGSRMFRFLRSDSSVPEAAQKSRSANMYQVVDMKPLRQELADGLARLDCSAWFQWVPSPTEKGMTFAVNVWTFTGEPSILTANWRDHLYRETAKSSSKQAFDASPAQWRQLKGSMIIPPDTDFLVIELKAIPTESAPGAEPYAFAGCYADDVRMVLSTGSAARLAVRSQD